MVHTNQSTQRTEQSRSQDDRRLFRRLASSSEACEVEIDGIAWDASLADESIGGFSIIGLNAIMLAKDTPIKVCFKENVIHGVCKHVTSQEGFVRIGVERVFSHSNQEVFNAANSDAEFLIVPFTMVDGLFVKCFPIELLPSGKLLVVLANKELRLLDPHDVKSFSRSERERQLQASNVLDFLKSLYAEEMNVERAEISAQDLLDFEFGKNGVDDLFSRLKSAYTRFAEANLQ
ncbi:MAG TPA: hypothetical protein PKD64_18725 [Pirellulaceae bacterium]|nr:hypothetical protein [Pirellulaceae bacterium]HMO94226.1 hypothetical protein [Pirellulaceae bacterium]HMP71262.1 hypothetical protein [Pirellulaceae bacterium]